MKVLTLRKHEKPINSIKINYDGDLVFSASSDTFVQLWRTLNGERLGSFKCNAAIKCIEVTKDSKYLISGNLIGDIEIFQVEGGNKVATISIKRGRVKNLELNLSNDKIMIAFDGIIPETYVFIIDFKKLLSNGIKGINNEYSFDKSDPMVLKSFYLPGYEINQVRWGFLDKYLLISTDEAGMLIKTDLEGNILQQTKAHNQKIASIAIAPKFSMIMTCGNDGGRIYDPETFKLLRFFKQDFPMNVGSFSPLMFEENYPKYHCIMGGGLTARETATTKNVGVEIHLCNLPYEEEIGKIGGHYGPVNDIAFGKDGRFFVTGAEEGLVRIYKFEKNYFEDPEFA